jgi:hypothetical protein
VEITIINLYAPNVSGFNPTLLNISKGLKITDRLLTVVVGDFNTPLSLIDRSSRQEILELNDTRPNGTDRWLQSIPSYNSTIYIFSIAHGTFSKIHHIFGHKASLNKYKKIEIIPCILCDHNAIKSELKNKRSSRTYANNWRLNNNCSMISGT